MKLLRKLYMDNVKAPKNNFLGRMQLNDMNKRHAQLADWGMSHMDFSDKKHILDIGCGGGKNIENMIIFAPHATFCAVDYSQASVKKTKKLNKEAIKQGKLHVYHACAEKLPFKNNTFDLITAFETVYFWNLTEGFNSTFSVLREGGKFMIVNEATTEKGLEEYIERIGFSVYNQDELITELSKVGFKDISAEMHDNGKWVVVIATK